MGKALAEPPPQPCATRIYIPRIEVPPLDWRIGAGNFIGLMLIIALCVAVTFWL